jgi:hypothetical protein
LSAASTPTVEPARGPRVDAPRSGPWWHTWLTDPARCFLAIGLLGGVLLMIAIPPLDGIDEPAHFVRAYQVSTGQLMPDTPPGKTEGGGACIPIDLARDIGRQVSENFGNKFGDPDRRGSTPIAVGTRRGCSSGERFVDFSAFGWNSPILYAPEAVTLAVTRPFGIGLTASVILTRIVGLAVYLALVFVAIRRSPFARWGLAALALLPVALFQAASARAPDLMTTGVALLVVVSALRAVAGGTDRALGSPLVERLALCSLLGLLKPTYAVLGLCFLLPLVGRRQERKDPVWMLVAPAAVAVGASVVWQVFASHYFVCDTAYGYFGFAPDQDAQRELILGDPLRYAGEVLVSFWDFAGQYAREAATVGVTNANWHWLAIAAALGAVVLAGSRRDPTERFGLGIAQRVLLLGIAFAGMVLLITGEHLYCAPVGLDIVYPPHARHFVPVLAAVVIALTPSRSDAPPGWSTRIPSAVLLLVVTVAFAWTVAMTMR